MDRRTPNRNPIPADEPTTAPSTGGGSDGVFDLDAAVADAMRDVFPFDYKGAQWHMTHPGSVDYRDAEAADSGQVEAVRTVIAVAMGAEWTDGDGTEENPPRWTGEQWDDFDELDLPNVALDRLFRAWLQHYGIKPGELQGSAAHFGGTAAPSNRASRRGHPNSGSSLRRGGGGTSRR